jgi:HAE1 family hydrophobic/amphiphilic exporter-1
MSSARRPSRLYSLFVDRPVLTLMATVALLLVGMIALLKVPLAFLPEGYTSHTVRMWIPIPRPMPPREVEEAVAKPFEELVRTISGLKSVRSVSSPNSVQVDIDLDEGLDPSVISAEVRDRAQRARLVWPREVDRYYTWREDGSSMPLAFFQILTPRRTRAGTS